jgi:hypothetical protein
MPETLKPTTYEKQVPNGKLVLAICPDCGCGQLTVPLDEQRRVTLVIEHIDLLHLIAGVVEAIDRFREGKLRRDNLFLPAKCCAASQRH